MNDDSSDPVYLTQQEAAILICKKPRWLEKTRYAGGGPPFRYVGRTPVYEKSELIAWMKSLTTLMNTSQQCDENDDDDTRCFRTKH